MTLYIYADETTNETQFLNDGNSTNKLIGYGMLLVEQPIDDSIVQWALDELKKEIDDGKINDPRDHNIVENGYFHATDDSPDGHGHICQSINDNINGNFNFLYLNPPFDENRKDEQLYRLTLQLAYMAHDQIRDEVIFTYESRSSFKINSAEIWKKEYENKLEKRVIQDGFPTTFPKIEMVEDNKSNPGLQVTDFILWATSKRIKDSIDSKFDWYDRPDLDDWYDRLNLNLLDTFHTTDNYIQGGTIAINKELHIPNIVYPKISLNKVDPIYSYLNIERYLRNIAQSGLPNHASNHSKRLNYLIKKLDNETMSNETLREVAALFLILFDTIPIYNNSTDKTIWASLLALRNLSRLWLNQRSADGSWQKIHILHWRYENFKLNPQLFLEDPFS